MATTVAHNRPPASRRSTSISSSSNHSPSPSISKGATARSAANPRTLSSSPASRHTSLRPPSASSLHNGETRESLSASLRQETEAKEQLLVQLQNKEQLVTTLTEDNDHMSSALNAAESRLAELYTEQNRMEEEIAARIEVAEKLRTQVRELEREKRDLQRRYNEQATTFEAERQAFYDNEIHLKSRIQSLSQARKQPPPPPPAFIDLSEDEQDEEPQPPLSTLSAKDEVDTNDEPAEMTALRLELSTLESSYSSMQNTVSLLQNQLNDLKRVNHTLQEENESYNILLRERTLNGQFDVMRQIAVASDNTASSDQDEDEFDDQSRTSDLNGYLDTVDEHPDESLDPEYAHSTDEEGQSQNDVYQPRKTRNGRRPHNPSQSPKHRGESLAGLPITGPGLDLAAELGRAEHKDSLGGAIDTQIAGRGKRGKKALSESQSGMLEPSSSSNDMDAMKSKIKALEDANKALSLYASKIIDRIIAQEGFEHVLAVDYESAKTPTSPNPQPPPSKVDKTKRRASMFARTSSPVNSPTPPKPERLTTFDSIAPPSPNLTPPNPTSTPAIKRRSLSFDWRTFALFSTDKKPEINQRLRPLTLQAGASTVTGARKLDTHEDDEDRRERERLHATMKLMGIEQPVPMQKSYTAPEPDTKPPSVNSASGTSNLPSRFSFFRRATATASGPHASSSPTSETAVQPTVLTQDALMHAEAENTLAALDAHERQLSVELAKGGGSGFTEIQRKSRRGRMSGGGGSGSGSTVWSAGMSRMGEDGDD